MADGTTFQIDLVTTGAASAAALATTADRLGEKLQAAKAAAKEASDAVAAGEKSYREAETSADRAAKALEKINVAADAQRQKMKAAMDIGDARAFWKAAEAAENLAQRQTEAASKAASLKAALATEAASLDKLKASAAAAAAEETRFAKAESDAAAAAKRAAADEKSAAEKAAAAERSAAEKAQQQAKEAAEAAEGTGSARAIASGLGKIGGPLGVLGQKAFGLKAAWDKLGKSLGDAAPYAVAAVGLAAVVAGVVAVGAAAVVGLVKITAWSIGLSDAARSQRILSEGITQSVKGGAQLDAAITKLATRVPQTREELTNMAAELAKTGLRGDALTATLERNAEAAAKLKFGPEWQKQMLSLDVQQRRLHDNVAGLFSGLKIDKLLEQFSTLVDLFDANTESGKAIKVVFESIFQPITDAATGAIPQLRAAFFQVEIIILRGLIALKGVWNDHATAIHRSLEELRPLGDFLKGQFIGSVISMTAALLYAAEGALKMVVAFGRFYNDVRGVSDAITAFKATAVQSITDTFAKIRAFLTGFSLSDLGTAIMQGLANGITHGASAVISAVVNVASDAVKAARQKLDSHSPSRVFMAVGTDISAGLAQGVTKGGDDVGDAVQDVVSPRSALASVPNVSTGAQVTTSSSGDSYTFHITGSSKDAEDIADKIRQVISDVAKGAAIQIGTAVPA